MAAVSWRRAMNAWVTPFENHLSLTQKMSDSAAAAAAAAFVVVVVVVRKEGDDCWHCYSVAKPLVVVVVAAAAAAVVVHAQIHHSPQYLPCYLTLLRSVTAAST